MKLGSTLADIGRKLSLMDDELAALESVRDTTPARAASFE